MKTVLQRVQKASVIVDDKEIASIQHGLVLLLGIHKDDTTEDIHALGNKVASLRCFNDSEGKMNLNIQDISGELLIVSQFTLYGNCLKGNRPSFTRSARPEEAKKLYLEFIDYMSSKGIPIKTGCFGAKMTIPLEGDGPITLILESAELLRKTEKNKIVSKS